VLQACLQLVGVAFLGGDQLAQVEGGGEPLSGLLARFRFTPVPRGIEQGLAAA
jgi:hypothetical protein